MATTQSQSLLLKANTIPSRYDAMYPSDALVSDTLDTGDNNVYPDVLSVEYSNIKLTQPPIEYDADFRWQTAPWAVIDILTNNGKPNGKTTFGEDVIMNMNGIPHMNLLDTNNTTLQIPVGSDFYALFTKSKKYY